MLRKKPIDKRKGPKDSRWVSSEETEMRTISERFVGYPSGKHIPISTLYDIYFAMKSNTHKVLRTEFYKILDIMGYAVDPQIAEK